MNILDTRDLEERRQELQDLKDKIDELKQAGLSDQDIEVVNKLADLELKFGEDEAKELEELNSLAEEIGEWKHGESLIPCSDFQDYAEQFAEDIGAINRDCNWPLDCIDWEKAADELAMDYTTVTYQGTDYYVRS